MENDGHCRYWQLLRSFSSAWLWTSCIHRGKTAWNTAYTEFYSDSTSTDLIWPSEKLEFNTKHYRSCLWHKCNSGVHKGAANILEDVLQKYVFCLACRASHIGNCNWSCLGKLKAQKTPGSRNFEMFSRIFQKTIKQLLAWATLGWKNSETNVYKHCTRSWYQTTYQRLTAEKMQI